MNPKRVTIYDIAERVGVSHVTVSRALRNHSAISAERRAQVKKAAEEMGYRPDPFLASLAAYRQRNNPVKIRSALAWINHWEQPEQLRKKREFDAYWRGAKEVAERLGYHLDEVRWPTDCSAKRFEGILVARGVRGVLIPPHRTPPDWGEFDWSKFSIIRFGMSVKRPDSNLVTSDQFRAVSMAIARIHEYGYQRIGLIVGGGLDRNLGGPYFAAYRWAQELLKLSPALPPLQTEFGNLTRAEIEREKRALQKWLAKHKPDAILTTDAETPGLVRELGYRVPQDIALAATSISDIPLDAGIDQHSEAIGRIAVEMLVKQINADERGEPADPCRILIESRWQDGKSLSRLKAS